MEDMMQATLVMQARNGDQSAIHQIYNDTRDFAYYVVKSYLGDDEKNVYAVLKDSYIQAFGNLDSFQQGAPFGKWLHGILAINCVKVLRSKKAKVDTKDAAMPFFEDKDVFPRDWVDADDKRWNLSGALSRLEPGQKIVLTMYYLSGMAPQEIAAHTGIADMGVMALLQSAKAALTMGNPEPIPTGKPAAITLLLQKEAASTLMPADMAKGINQEMMMFFMTGGKAPKIGAAKSSGGGSGGGNKMLSTIIWAGIIVLVIVGLVISILMFQSKQRKLGEQLVSEYQANKVSEQQDDAAYESAAQEASPPDAPGNTDTDAPPDDGTDGDVDTDAPPPPG